MWLILRAGTELVKRLRLSYFPVAERFYYFEDLGPSGEKSCVLFLIAVDSHKEFKLFVGHSALFSGFSLIAQPPTWASSPIESQAPVNYVLSAVFAGSALREIVFVHFLCGPSFTVCLPSNGCALLHGARRLLVPDKFARLEILVEEIAVEIVGVFVLQCEVVEIIVGIL